MNNRARIKELEAEIARLRAEPATYGELLPSPVKPKDERPIYAGEFLPRGQMLVVEEETRTAYAHPKHKTIANKVRIHGTARAEYQKGEAVAIKPWWLEDDNE